MRPDPFDHSQSRFHDGTDFAAPEGNPVRASQSGQHIIYTPNQTHPWNHFSTATTANIIDSEVKRLVQAGYDEAKRILSTRLDDLHAVAKALLEYETLSGDEILGAMKGIKPNRDESETRRPTGPTVAVPISPRPSAEPA